MEQVMSEPHNEFQRYVDEMVRAALAFEGDVPTLAPRARDGDRKAVDELVRAYAALAVITGIRLRPSWLPVPDATQEAMVVLLRLIETGSTSIETELPVAVGATMAGLTKPPDEPGGPSRGRGR
jgi:hypothetical protein